MKVGPLSYDEMNALEKDLASGTPLDQAITRRELPEFYVRMGAAGSRSNDFPGMLTLLADYYAKPPIAFWNRLKGLMVYPFLGVDRFPRPDHCHLAVAKKFVGR